jgi:signal transduction histidine kinase/ActR/RegA family two-component response regulator
MSSEEKEQQALRSVALQNVQSILRARQQAERELLRTKESLEEETRILELLNRTGTILASKLEVEAVVQAVTDAATQLSGARFGAFFYNVTGAEGEAFSLYTLSGASREAFENFGHPRATPIFAPTFRGEGVIRIADVRQDPRYGQMGPHHGMPPGHLAVTSYLAVPVIGRSGDVIGGLFFGHPEPGIFSERAERLIVGVAAQAAIAIDNARLYTAAKTAAHEREKLLNAERSARAEVERISLLKDEFLATLSHELRTPLSSILGWSQVLLSRCADNSEMHQGLETITRNARAQSQLVEDLLDMNRIVSGKIRLDVQRVDLVPVIDAVLDSVRPSVEAKEITVRRTIDPRAGLVLGDPNRLQQVIWNLLTNAVKFTAKGGNIDVVMQRVNSHVEISVHDNGCGITAEFLPHLFERFRQADSSSTRKHGGLGLGLSIVKQLVELHGGTVQAESNGVGQGATFTVKLPLRAVQDLGGISRDHPTTGRHDDATSSVVSLNGIRVLVVDDEPDARELVRAVLVYAHAEVLVAASADEALRLVRDERFDVIVSDIGMPGRDGYQFMRDVRALDGERAAIPAIALTAFARSRDRTQAMLAGFQVHVSKPIEPQELVASVKSLTLHKPTQR